jgi:hypothetical protein
VDALATYLIGHIVLDFNGEVSMEQINTLLLEDGSALAKKLRSRLIQEGGPDDFLLVLADCLRESLRRGINEEAVKEQIDLYLNA